MTDAGNPAGGTYDLQFVLFDAASGGSLAAARGATPSEAAGLWREARDAYAQGLERALGLQARHALMGEGVDEHPARLGAGVDRCDAALAAAGRS